MTRYYTKYIPWSQTIAIIDNPQVITLRTKCRTISLNPPFRSIAAFEIVCNHLPN